MELPLHNNGMAPICPSYGRPAALESRIRQALRPPLVPNKKPWIRHHLKNYSKTHDKSAVTIGSITEKIIKHDRPSEDKTCTESHSATSVSHGEGHCMPLRNSNIHTGPPVVDMVTTSCEVDRRLDTCSLVTVIDIFHLVDIDKAHRVPHDDSTKKVDSKEMSLEEDSSIGVSVVGYTARHHEDPLWET